MNIATPILFLIFISLSPSILAQTASTQHQNQKPTLGRIETVQDFEASLFYQAFKPLRGKSWRLRTGGVNTVYTFASQPDIDLELQTDGERVLGFGITFNTNRTMIKDDTMAFITKLLLSIDAKHTNSKVTDYIKRNAIRDVKHIHKVRPISYGAFKVYAGRVIAPIISIERDLVIKVPGADDSGQKKSN
jgi:hypothetical protein